MEPLEPVDCPDCLEPMAPCPLSPDPDARVCRRCGMDRLGAIMAGIAAGEQLWDYREADVHLRWKDGAAPAAAELTALKNLVPSLRRMPAARLTAALGGGPVWFMGTFRANEARALYVRARELGLDPELVYRPETRGTSQEDDDEIEEEE
jgi:hypothetical protein